MRGACAAAVALLLGAGTAHAAPGQESTFQDDDLLVYGEPATVTTTLDTLRTLGVDRLRISVFWKVVGPAPAEDAKPSGFDGSDPGAYPAGTWERYDHVLREATARGLRVNFNVTGPAPDWATGTPERADIDETFEPSAEEFQRFVQALGRRYSGTWSGADGRPLPRVDYWSVWNEPNHGGWLTPQWGQDPRGGEMIETSPRIYRALVGAAHTGLRDSGHADDTFLIGETAPKGLQDRGITRSMAPGRFLRRLYCLDDRLRPLKGSSAELLGCPVSGAPADVVAQNPGLFAATGWAHHPYELSAPPSRRPRDRDWFTIANAGDLTKLVRRVRSRFGRPGLPLYLTEFGYQTNPPDPLGITPGRQAAYLDESEYRAWRDRHVRTLAQFLLVDDEPLPGYPTTTTGAWGSTFQTGLRNLDGTDKPAMRSYQLPVHLPAPSIRRGSRLRVWGLARAAAGRPRVQVLLRTTGRPWRVARTVSGTVNGYVDVRLGVRRSGSAKLRWTHPDGRVLESRTVRFSVRRASGPARPRR